VHFPINIQVECTADDWSHIENLQVLWLQAVRYHTTRNVNIACNQHLCHHESQIEKIPCTWWLQWICTPTWLLYCSPEEHRKEKLLNVDLDEIKKFQPEGQQQNCMWHHGMRTSDTYLWTSTSPRRLVICQVKPRSGSRPGCEISRPCFLTSSMYLQIVRRFPITSNSEMRTLYLSF
jgi:hypothetical protein